MLAVVFTDSLYSTQLNEWVKHSCAFQPIYSQKTGCLVESGRTQGHMMFQTGTSAYTVALPRGELLFRQAGTG